MTPPTEAGEELRPDCAAAQGLEHPPSPVGAGVGSLSFGQAPGAPPYRWVQATTAAVRALNKALGEATDPELTEALTAARGALAGWLEAKGLRVPKPGKKREKAATAA